MSGIEQQSHQSKREATVEITSTGKVGKIEHRSFGRLYLSDPATYQHYADFRSSWVEMTSQAEKADCRRVVYRTFVTGDVLSKLLLDSVAGVDGWPYSPEVEMAIPLTVIDGTSDNQSPTTINNDQTYLIILAQNRHESAISSREQSRVDYFKEASASPKPMEQDSEPLTEKVCRLKEAGYSLTFTPQPSDEAALLALWGHNFDWTKEGIQSFISDFQENPPDNIWFSGVRDKNERLVAASMGEAVWFNDRYFAELTEWAAQVEGVASVMVVSLIAQILDILYYSQQADTAPLIVAEMNTHHADSESLGAIGAGLSADLRMPQVESVPQVLRHNVKVGDGRPEIDTAGGDFIIINNYVIGVLTGEIRDDSYPRNTIKQILDQVTN